MDQPEVQPEDSDIDNNEPVEVDLDEPIIQSEEVDQSDITESDLSASSIDASSIQIAPTPKSLSSDLVEDYEIDPMLFVQLGDYIYFESTKYGNGVGIVYYRSLEAIHVRQNGVSNRVVVFELEQTDDEEKYKDEYGVKQIIILQKRTFESFVIQNDFRAGQLIDTFDSMGEMYKRYKITGVDKDNDLINIIELDEEGLSIEDTEKEVLFNYIGIDPSEPFQVISIYQYDVKDEAVQNADPNELHIPLHDTTADDIDDTVEEDDDTFTVYGKIKIIKPRIYREAASYEQVIPDHIQKVDALNNFISNLDLKVQKDPKVIRAQRLLVETLHQLKQDTISYWEDGSIRGQKVLSATTLSELVDMVSVPLGRPVLDVKKKGYMMSNEGFDEVKDTDDFFFKEIEAELDDKLEKYSAIVSAPSQKGVSQQIREWVDKAHYFKSFLTPWLPKDMEVPIWSALRDSEFFRNVSPSLAELGNNSHVLLPQVDGFLASHTNKFPPTFDQILFGMERALSATYCKNTARSRITMMNEEKASLVSYLLFPMRVAPYIGSKRTHSIAIDSGRSQMPFKTMRTVLEEVGDPKQEGGTSKDIILIDTTVQAYGTLRLDDYLAGQTIPALGFADTYYVLNQYGLDDLELNKEVAQVLETKISMYQDQLRSAIGEMREEIKKKAQEPAHTPELNHLIVSPNFLATVRTQPLLSQAIDEYEQINPSSATLDIGIVNHLMKKHNNYFQVTAGMNNYYIQKAFYDENNRQFHDMLHINYILQKKKENAGKIPKRNKCPHVADMVSIRKIKDDDEKFSRLAKVYTHYQGAYKDNWFHCNLCKERFLCIHERLQLNAFLKPVEKSIIEKEIILNCSGGQFQGKYICRNCGQSMRELDFDNNLEFDDEGKPKSGRSIVEDKDALLEEKIEMMINSTVENTEKEKLNLNEEESVCYEIARELSERVGVELDRAGFRFIIQYTLMIMSKFPNQSVYAKYRQTKPQTIPTYEVAFSRKYISVCAVLILIEIQTKIPAYKIRYALRGCDSPGFGGYPIAGDKEKTEGLNYISCAISTIRRQDGIFHQTGYHQIVDPVKRTEGILKYLQNVLETDIIKLDIVQANIAAKIAYMAEMDGGSDVAMDSRPRDQIPSSFLPEQVVLKPEDAAKDVITPEVAQAMGANGRTALIKLWIRQAHRIAQENSRMMRGSPLTEASCCFHPISQNSDKWFNELPSLGIRSIIPNRQGQFMVTEFIPREADAAVTKPNPELYYRLFLKYCFDGPNMGKPHDPNLTNICTWCGFEFPTHPSIMDVKKQGLTAIQSQNVDTSDEKFTELLDTIHTVNNVELLKQNEHSTVETILTKFSEVNPSPIPEWKDVIQETIQAFLKLPPRAMRSDMVQARARISDAVTESITRFSTYFPKKGDNEVIYNILDKISELSWSNFFQVIQTYFITTLQRLLSNYSDTALFVPVELIKDLSDIHVKMDIQPRLEKELVIVSKYREPMQKDSYAFVRSKLRYFLKQLSEVLPYKGTIRAVLVPDRDKSLVYFQKLILFGCLATLIDPDHIPDEDVSNPIKSSGKSASKAIITLLVDILRKYRSEYISYDEQEIRNQIAIREEKERVHVISEFNKLTEEERKIELINKKYGLGKWAVGGTSLTYKYNKDYYDLERLKRNQGGYGGHSDESNIVEYGGQEYDEDGFPLMDEDERDDSLGYDMADQPDD